MNQPQFSQFLESCALSDKISIDHFRSPRFSVVENFSEKFKQYLRNQNPTQSITESLELLDTESNSDRLALVGTLIKSIDAFSEPSHKLSTSDIWVLFTYLRENALHDYFQSISSMPGNGGLLQGVFEIAGYKFEYVDSMFLNSYGDTFGILSIGKLFGQSRAFELAKTLFQVRSNSGDFNQFSKIRDSLNTEYALIEVLSALDFNNVVKLGAYTTQAIRNQAFKLSLTGLQKWMISSRHIDTEKAESIHSLITDLFMVVMSTGDAGNGVTGMTIKKPITTSPVATTKPRI